MISDEQAEAFANAASDLGSEIVGTYADDRGIDSSLLGFGAMHAAVFSLLRAGYTPQEIAALARDHAGDVTRSIRAFADQLDIAPTSTDRHMASPDNAIDGWYLIVGADQRVAHRLTNDNRALCGAGGPSFVPVRRHARCTACKEASRG